MTPPTDDDNAVSDADNSVLDAKVIALDRKREKQAAWIKRCVVGDTGKPHPILANALEFLRAAGRLILRLMRCCAPRN
jgi:hypothetical protein